MKIEIKISWQCAVASWQLAIECLISINSVTLSLVRKVKTFFLILTSVVLFVCKTQAHTNIYYSAFGIRVGKFNSGISYKHFYNTDNATAIQIDAYFTHMADGGYTVKGYYLRQIPFKLPIIQLPLDFIYGGGLHVGYFPIEDLGYYKIRHGDAVFYRKSVFSGGVDGTVQIEYQVKRKIAPITVTLDCVPFFEFYNPGPEFVDFGVSVRYTFR